MYLALCVPLSPALLTALPASPFMLLLTGHSVCLSDKKLNTALLCAALCCATALRCRSQFLTEKVT
jgi:hypothetical protein